MVEAFRQNGVPLDVRAIAELRGAGKREAIARLLDRGPEPGAASRLDLADRISASFRDILGGIYQTEGIRPVEGAPETLTWLRDAGIRVAFNTGFERESMDLILAQSAWLGEADAIVCGDEVSRGRPAPYMIFRAMELTGVTDVRRVMAVGDTVNDLLAGANAGVAAIVGVLTGSQGWDKLATVAHTHVLRSVAGIPGLIEREFGRV
jgi:phosphonatase-like hydrolase